MVLIILSLIMGCIGFMLGGIFGIELFAFLFGIVGILSPALYVLEQLYKQSKKNSN